MNVKIIGGRNIGKTTYLMNKIKNCKSNFAILDSATDHKDKSLIYKYIREYNDCCVIQPTDIDDVVFEFKSPEDYYEKCLKSKLYQKMVHNVDNVICVDLAYYLEKGFENEENNMFVEANKCREIYNIISQQAAVCLMGLVNEGVLTDITVFTDEIEFPLCEFNISQFQNEKVQFMASVHPENSFGTFYESFNLIAFEHFKGNNVL